ncbi:MAG: preprotein translocase subunit YajC [Bacteriovoracales bacterium]|nr:preprotein translocase subunit YajC [Bacteriovoracales bacterium]
MVSMAYAQQQTQQAQEAPQPNPMMSFVPFILVFAVFYFLMIRPQKKRMAQEKTFLESLKRGDEVYTKSGIIGTIVGLTDKVVDLEITKGVKIKILRTQVADMAEKLFPPKKTAVQGIAAQRPK